MNTVIDSFFRNSRRHREKRYIEAARTIAAYVFPSAVLFHAREGMPEGMLDDAIKGLKNYFLAHAHLRFAPKDATRKHLAMPSAGVDALWHAFVLDTQAYAAFCNAVYGELLHHVPAGPTALNPDIDWRTRHLSANAQTLVHVQAARDDLTALSPHSVRAFGALSTLFSTTAYVTPVFPYTFEMQELALQSEREAQLQLQRQAQGSSGGGDSSAPICLGHCGDASASADGGGRGFGGFGGDGGDGGAGGDGGGSGCGGGCGGGS